MVVLLLVGFDYFQQNRTLHCRGNQSHGLREQNKELLRFTMTTFSYRFSVISHYLRGGLDKLSCKTTGEPLGEAALAFVTSRRGAKASTEDEGRKRTEARTN